MFSGIEKIRRLVRIVSQVEQLALVVVAEAEFPAVGRNHGADVGPGGPLDLLVGSEINSLRLAKSVAAGIPLDEDVIVVLKPA